jgi:hypothetical protein
MKLLINSFGDSEERLISDIIENRKSGYYLGDIQQIEETVNNSIEITSRMLELFVKKNLITQNELSEILGVEIIKIL